MAKKKVLFFSAANPENREAALEAALGGQIEVVFSDARFGANPKRAIAEAIDAEGGVDAVVLPRNFLGRIAEADAFGPNVTVLVEEYKRDQSTGRVITVGQDGPYGRSRFRVSHYMRLIEACLQTSPVEHAELAGSTGRVLVVSRHQPNDRRERLAEAFGRDVEIVIDDVPFYGHPLRALKYTVERLGDITAIVVPYGCLWELRFADAFGPDVVILVEQTKKDETGENAVTGREATGRDRFTVSGYTLFHGANLRVEQATATK